LCGQLLELRVSPSQFAVVGFAKSYTCTVRSLRYFNRLQAVPNEHTHTHTHTHTPTRTQPHKQSTANIRTRTRKHKHKSLTQTRTCARRVAPINGTDFLNTDGQESGPAKSFAECCAICAGRASCECDHLSHCTNHASSRPSQLVGHLSRATMRLVCLLTLTRISVFLSHRRHAAARKHQPLTSSRQRHIHFKFAKNFHCSHPHWPVSLT
jgi:hypothetical protein